MSAIVNERDLLLQAAATRFTPPNDRALLLGASSTVFKVPLSGQVAPATINLAAILLGMTGVVTFNTTPATKLTVSNNVATLAFADTGVDPVTVTASFTKDGFTYEARQTISRVMDGQPGSDGLAGTSTGLAYAYKRSVAAPTDNPGAATFTFSQGRITSPGTDALANGWSKSIPAGTDPLYVTVASASNSGATDEIAAGEWAAPVLYVQNGLNSATVMIYQRSASAVPPALPTADSTYTFASSALTGLNNGWSSTVPAASAGAYLYVSTATAVSAGVADTIAPGEWAAVRQMTRDGRDGQDGVDGLDGENGTNGQRGTVDVVSSGYSSWSDSAANGAIALAGYGAPVNRDRVTLTGTGYAETRFYNAGSWLAIAAYVNGNMLVDGTFSASKISGGILSGVIIRFGSGHTPGGYAFEIQAGGVVWVDNLFGGVLQGSNFYANFSHGVDGACYKSGYAGVRGMVPGTGAGVAVQGDNVLNGTAGQIGTAAYDFYASGGGTNYGPFTGAHDALVPIDAAIELGDLVVDVQCVGQRGLSNSIFTVERTSMPYQRGVRGPVAAIAGPLADHEPSALVQEVHEAVNGEGKSYTIMEMSEAYHAMASTHQLVAMNGVGEGWIKVCGEGGPLQADDLLVTSSIPGVAQRQNVGQDPAGVADDLVRGYTVAKARVAKGQSIQFASNDEVIVVPCIYLGG
jgi:hypothetical protein